MKNRRQKGKRHPYDFNGVIKDHTSNGDSESNIKLLGLTGAVPRSASVSINTGNNKKESFTLRGD